MEAAATKTATIFTLTVDVFLYILRFLAIEDKISFALSCERFRRLCVDERVFRKLDLSRCPLSTTQRSVVNKFFRDRQLTQHIRELNLSNLCVLNWQMDDHLEEFIKSVCPHLEALHVLNCGVSLKTLQCILQEAPNLKSLSWSLWDFTSEDIEFLSKTMESSEGICLKKIKHLHIEMLRSLPHIQITNYLVLSSCKDLEELEIYTWWIPEAYGTGGSLCPRRDQMIPSFPEPSVGNELNNLHSLVVATVGCLYNENYNETFRSRLSDFVISLLSRKSSSTKWKKFCILPSIGINKDHFSLLRHKFHSDEFHSVEAVGANPGESPDAVDELKTLFESIGDNNVKNLHLFLPNYNDSIVELCEPILRLGGPSLKMLRLFVHVIRAEQNVFIHTLFSNCMNIAELDLLYCIFEKDICESLSELKHLTKVQLKQCAISSKYNENEAEISKANLLTFVENCKNITHLDVRGCWGLHRHFSCRLTDGDLLALDRLRNLVSLTIYRICGITEWTFLQNISNHCKFLKTLRISTVGHFNTSHIPILMESSMSLVHLAIDMRVPVLGSEVFWNHLSHAKNLERLCIRSHHTRSEIIPAAVETLRSLPRLHVLHLHNCSAKNIEFFYHQIRTLEEKESDCRCSFEIVTENRRNTWISHPTEYSLIFKKVLPLNKAELCNMTPILDIPRF